MNELYSAEKAREYSMKYRYKDEIEDVNEKINEAVLKGETSCAYYDLLSSFVEDIFFWASICLIWSNSWSRRLFLDPLSSKCSLIL